MRASDKKQLLKSSRADVLSSRKKLRRTSEGGGKKKIYKPHIPALNDGLGLWEGRSPSISELFWRVTIK